MDKNHTTVNLQRNQSSKIINQITSSRKITVEVEVIEGLQSLESTDTRSGRGPWSLHQGDEQSHYIWSCLLCSGLWYTCILKAESKTKAQLHALLPSHNDQSQVTRVGRPKTRFLSTKMHKHSKKPVPRKRGTKLNKQNYSLWLKNSVRRNSYEEEGTGFHRRGSFDASPDQVVCKGSPMPQKLFKNH